MRVRIRGWCSVFITSCRIQSRARRCGRVKKRKDWTVAGAVMRYCNCKAQLYNCIFKLRYAMDFGVIRKQRDREGQGNVGPASSAP